MGLHWESLGLVFPDMTTNYCPVAYLSSTIGELQVLGIRRRGSRTPEYKRPPAPTLALRLIAIFLSTLGGGPILINNSLTRCLHQTPSWVLRVQGLGSSQSGVFMKSWKPKIPQPFAPPLRPQHSEPPCTEYGNPSALLPWSSGNLIPIPSSITNLPVAKKKQTYSSYKIP